MSLRFASLAVRRCALVFTACALFTVLAASVGQAGPTRPFTVEDSIEMSYLVNPVLWPINQEPPSRPEVSPDGRWFLVVSERGALKDNSLASTIWVFDRHAVSAFVSGSSGERPAPKEIATFSATSNTPVISDVRWLPN